MSFGGRRWDHIWGVAVDHDIFAQRWGGDGFSIPIDPTRTIGRMLAIGFSRALVREFDLATG
jgi:hypothetical protein